MEDYVNYLSSCEREEMAVKVDNSIRETQIVREELVLIPKTELAKLKLESFILNEILNETDSWNTKCLHQGCISFNICLEGTYGQTYGPRMSVCDFCGERNYCSDHSSLNLTQLKQNNGHCWLACYDCFIGKINSPDFVAWKSMSDHYVQ